MQKKTDEQIKNTEWANQLLLELEKRTGRKDIELTITSYSSHDVLVSISADDKHPIINFCAAIKGVPARVAEVLDYTSEMLQSWELSIIWLEKANRDCLPIYERLKREFPHMESAYHTADSGKHCAQVARIDGKVKSFFDLWPQMSEDDINRLISHIKELEDTLNRENATFAEVTYFWRA